MTSQRSRQMWRDVARYNSVGLESLIAFEVTNARPGSRSILKRRFSICVRDINIGTFPSSTISKQVDDGGSVGNHIRNISLQRVVWLFAKLKVACDGRYSISSPAAGAALANAVIAGREPIALVHPRSRITRVGYSQSFTGHHLGGPLASKHQSERYAFFTESSHSHTLQPVHP